MSQNSTTELVCETFDAYKITRFMHEDERYFSFSPVIAQIGLVTLLKTIFQFLLLPFGQQRFVSEILVIKSSPCYSLNILLLIEFMKNN